jgi:hypothetical protein
MKASGLAGIVATLLLLAGCGGWGGDTSRRATGTPGAAGGTRAQATKAPWPADARQQLTGLCREIGTARYCTCLIAQIEQRYTVAEFDALTTEAMGRAIVELGASCPDAPRR